ncbi:cytochrome c oxidase subunit V [Tieghemostelium lacteum]|uniref:Cytochrome c oxidase subunit V n=1 Tax=Tieghemostelium lacteum TaxID=361077 RepID=A0A151ZAN0_TIELA|nr:cytochrome c oxidase subunit V [Tieghemostelium lacteum]|eukprot:KYQ90997.1 cytochrome c oxidase subunit V [Tieghemostelium lacteum]
MVTPSHSMEFFHKPASNSLADITEWNATRKGIKREDFGHEVLTGAFGTIKAPTTVESIFSERIVGCEGGNGEEHDIRYHKLTDQKPIICLDCGQAFKLKKISKENEVLQY